MGRKRKVGRPKGSKNKKHKKHFKYPKKVAKKTFNNPFYKKKIKRGRPKGSQNKKTLAGSQLHISKSRFQGYCPKCRFMISSLDLVSKFIFVCPGCGERASIKSLRKILKNEEDRPTSKKDYFDSGTVADYHDMPPLNDGVNIKNLNIQK